MNLRGKIFLRRSHKNASAILIKSSNAKFFLRADWIRVNLLINVSLPRSSEGFDMLSGINKQTKRMPSILDLRNKMYKKFILTCMACSMCVFAYICGTALLIVFLVCQLISGRNVHKFLPNLMLTSSAIAANIGPLIFTILHESVSGKFSFNRQHATKDLSIIPALVLTFLIILDLIKYRKIHDYDKSWENEKIECNSLPQAILADGPVRSLRCKSVSPSGPRVDVLETDLMA
ncbi:hypothetical protein GJ496_007514 [Pomphorhynchus laevis]|nr:hypothetical protein GJ496_007514 [Pomphorhynchus laevis]